MACSHCALGGPLCAVVVVGVCARAAPSLVVVAACAPSLVLVLPVLLLLLLPVLLPLLLFLPWLCCSASASAAALPWVKAITQRWNLFGISFLTTQFIFINLQLSSAVDVATYQESEREFAAQGLAISFLLGRFLSLAFSLTLTIANPLQNLSEFQLIYYHALLPCWLLHSPISLSLHIPCSLFAVPSIVVSSLSPFHYISPSHSSFLSLSFSFPPSLSLFVSLSLSLSIAQFQH